MGGRTNNPNWLRRGIVDYEALEKTDLFQEGISRIVEGRKQFRIVLLCAEKEPLDCHRTILVCKELRKRQIPILHILSDGSIEPHQETERRLLSLVDVSDVDLLCSPEERLDAAYLKRGRQIAYRPNETGEPSGIQSR